MTDAPAADTEKDDLAWLDEPVKALVSDAFVTDADTRRWGFMEDGTFIPVPKVPITLGGDVPPVTFALYFGERTIIVEPDA